MSTGDPVCERHGMMPCACTTWMARSQEKLQEPLGAKFEQIGGSVKERYPRFNELLTLMKTTHDAKGADYEGNGRPYENIRTGEDWGVEPWKMAMMRVGEKLKRLQSYAQKGSLNNESAFDSLLDIAVLSLIGYVLLEESKKAEEANPFLDDTPHRMTRLSHPTDADDSAILGYHL